MMLYESTEFSPLSASVAVIYTGDEKLCPSGIENDHDDCMKAGSLSFTSVTMTFT